MCLSESNLVWQKAMSLVPRLEIVGELEQEAGAWSAGPALGFEIPLFDRNQGQRAAAAAELRQRQEEYSALAVEIRSAVRTAHRRLLAARQTALSYQNEILPLQERFSNRSNYSTTQCRWVRHDYWWRNNSRSMPVEITSKHSTIIMSHARNLIRFLRQASHGCTG